MKDMTQGKPLSLILGFSLPLLAGLLFQQCYTLVDTVIVGKCLGVSALAAVGATGSINFLIIGFCIGVCNGFSIPIAQRFGAQDFTSLRRFVSNSIYLSVLFSAVMTVFVSLLCRKILILMDTPSDIIEQSYRYIFIIFLGIPVTYLYNLTASFIRSLGDSRTPVYFLLLASVVNIGLDLLFIIHFHMGVEGAAYATVISQFLAGLLCLFYMIKKFPILHFSRQEARLDAGYVKTLCSMGLPMGLQYSITAIGSVILQTAVNSLGSAVVASVTASSKITMFIVCPFDALGSTMATYGGQNVGARQLPRIKEGLKDSMILGAAYSVFSFVLLFFLSSKLLLLFLSPSETVILANSRTFILYQSFFFFTLAIVNIFRFLIQGMGFPAFAVIAGICEMVGRAFAGFVLVPIFGFTAACLASPLAWILADAFLIPAFFSVYKKLQRLFEERTSP